MLQLHSENNNKPNYSRRDFLRIGGLVLGGLTLADWMMLRAAEPERKISAKSVIYICLDGGSCHIDTFDPKPKAGRDITGPYKEALATNIAGILLNEKLVELAKIADKYSLIRSMSHGNNGHETAQYITQTGTMPGSGIIYPAFGASIAYTKANKSDMPSFITIPQASSRFNEAGFLGPDFKPYATGGAPEKPDFTPDGIGTGSFSAVQISRRKSLLETVDTFSRAFTSSVINNSRDTYLQKAWSLILGDAKEAFNLKQESEKTIDTYGRNRLGQSCLLARRLVERGIPMITVRSSGWDTHKQHFERMDEKLPELDKAIAALLNDLAERGLLQQTIVICGGEFGRTPKVQWEAPWNGGRGHFGAAFSYLVAGGGFKSGTILGETDSKGENVTSRPVHPSELIATIYTLMGIDYLQMIPHPYLGSVRLLPEWLKPGMGILKEIIL